VSPPFSLPWQAIKTNAKNTALNNFSFFRQLPFLNVFSTIIMAQLYFFWSMTIITQVWHLPKNKKSKKIRKKRVFLA